MTGFDLVGGYEFEEANHRCGNGLQVRNFALHLTPRERSLFFLFLRLVVQEDVVQNGVGVEVDLHGVIIHSVTAKTKDVIIDAPSNHL